MVQVRLAKHHRGSETDVPWSRARFGHGSPAAFYPSLAKLPVPPEVGKASQSTAEHAMCVGQADPCGVMPKKVVGLAACGTGTAFLA